MSGTSRIGARGALGALHAATAEAWARIFDSRRRDSLASSYRRRRLELLERLIATVPRPIRLLDVGGHREFWIRSGLAFEGIRFVILNLTSDEPDRGPYAHVRGDARDLREFEDGEFDIVFSNSVIEHLGTWEDQVRMAAAVRRVGRRYFVQTPNRRFPLEAHTLFPYWQYLPLGVRARMLQTFHMGWFKRIPDPVRARKAAASISLLSRKEMQRLFPEARIWEETSPGSDEVDRRARGLRRRSDRAVRTPSAGGSNLWKHECDERGGGQEEEPEQRQQVQVGGCARDESERHRCLGEQHSHSNQDERVPGGQRDREGEQARMAGRTRRRPRHERWRMPNAPLATPCPLRGPRGPLERRRETPFRGSNRAVPGGRTSRPGSTR